MDFSNRDVVLRGETSSEQNTAAGNLSPSRKKTSHDGNYMSRIIVVVLAAAVAILIGAVIALIIASNNTIKPESKYLNTGKLQAIFLNTGQVYFGHIKDLNDKYLIATDIYYLQPVSSNSGSGSSSGTSTSVSLVKLGCELHEPYDQMVISRSQVTFWENLQDNGKVAQAVSTFQKDNPKGQKCVDQTSSASTNGASSTQSTSSPATPATPASPAKP